MDEGDAPSVGHYESELKRTKPLPLSKPGRKGVLHPRFFYHWLRSVEVAGRVPSEASRAELFGNACYSDGSVSDSLKAWIGSLGRAAAIDDLLDALVGLVVAQGFVRYSGYVWTLPTLRTFRRRRGLRMEIWF